VLLQRAKVGNKPQRASRSRGNTNYDLIVLGVSNRPGDPLFFDSVVTKLLKEAPCSAMFIAS
jgi:hypothetical protein